MTTIKDNKTKVVKVKKEVHTIDINGECDNGCRGRCKQLRDA